MERRLFRRILSACAVGALLVAGCGGGGGGGGDDGAGPVASGDQGGSPGDAAGTGSQPSDSQGGSGNGSQASDGQAAAEKPEALPGYADVSPYSATSPINTPIPPDPDLDPDSEAMVRLLAGSGDLVIQVRQYSAPVYFADAATPRRAVELPCGPLWEIGVSRMTGVPIPAWAEPADDVDGADNPVPADAATCGEDADQDNHLIVLDLKTRCEYDFWQFRWVGGQAVASWGNATSLDGTGIYPQALSTRGSGFAFLAGVIWPDELAAGRIEHALVFNYPYTRAGGPVSPATATDGVWDGTEPELRALEARLGGPVSPMPEGARLQLDPGLDLDRLGLTPYEKTIARALQEYGMFLVDTGGGSGIGLYAIDPRSVRGDPYDGVLPPGDFVPLPHIRLDRFRVLATGPMDLDWQDKAGLSPGSCAAFE